MALLARHYTASQKLDSAARAAVPSAADLRLRPRIGDPISREEPLVRGREARLWELPVSFEFDDWPHFQFNFSPYRNGTSAPSKVLEIWTAEVDWMDANVDGGVLTTMMHPQVIGRGHRIAMLEQFIEHCHSRDGLAFARLGDVVLHLPDPRAEARAEGDA